LANDKTELTSKVIDAFSSDPCLLAILIVVGAAFFLIYQKDKSAEKMEVLRLSQWKTMMRPRKEIKDEHD
jgi:hypothetical protein